MASNTTSLKLSDELKEKVSTLAHGVAQTPHAYMVEAIAEKVARDEKRQAFLKEGERRVAEFKRTGIAYAHEDVWRYVLERVRGKKPRKPKPIRIPPSER